MQFPQSQGSAWIAKTFCLLIQHDKGATQAQVTTTTLAPVWKNLKGKKNKAQKQGPTALQYAFIIYISINTSVERGLLYHSVKNKSLQEILKHYPYAYCRHLNINFIKNMYTSATEIILAPVSVKIQSPTQQGLSVGSVETVKTIAIWVFSIYLNYFCYQFI